MNALNIGLVGHGGIGRVLAMAYRTIPFHYGLPSDLINIVGVATSSPDSARRAADEIGCDFCTADYHELLARKDIDIVDCCAPNYLHEEILVAAAQAGKH